MDGSNENGGVIQEVGGAEAGDFLQDFALGSQGGDGAVVYSNGLNDAVVTELLKLRVGSFGNAGTTLLGGRLTRNHGAELWP